MAEKLYLSVDGGGTKTEAVIFNEHGQICAHSFGRGCNPNDAGLENAFVALGDVLHELTSSFEQGVNVSLAAACAGISGSSVGDYQEKFKAFLLQFLPQLKKVKVCSDALIALTSGAGSEDAVVVISGTGSIAYTRVNGKIYKTGGWGHLLDRGGSGFDIGRDVIYSALLAFEGRAVPTILTQMIEQKTGKHVSELVESVYRLGKPFAAGFAPLAFKAAQKGDAAAAEIVKNNSQALAGLINAAALHLEKFPCKTVLTGSVFKSFAMLEPFILAGLKQEHKFILPQKPPVYGAFLEALLIDEQPVPACFGF